MMISVTKFFRPLLSAILFALALNVHLVSAQPLSGSGPTFYTGSYASKFARYYAPYALQAAGAYVPVAAMDQTLTLSRGEDVTRVVNHAIDDPTLTEKATKYLRAWQYQFGSEKYLNCFEDDADCLRANQDRFRIPLAEGPAFHVWARTGAASTRGAACSEVSIAFRGTDNVSWARFGTDWATNADSVVGWATDNSYRQLRRNIDAILAKISRLPCYRPNNRPQIVSVGHSLGAGLGQLAALANNPENKRRGLGITKVFAFDASPLTGSSYVPEATRRQNANVEVDLVYQNGEVLQSLRGRDSSPCLRTMRFDALYGANSRGLHNMAALSREMVRLVYDTDDGGAMRYRSPPNLPNCRGRYIAPANDNDEPSPDGSFTISRARSVTNVATASPGRAMSSFAMTNASGNGKQSDLRGNKKGAGTKDVVLQAAFDAAWPPG